MAGGQAPAGSIRFCLKFIKKKKGISSSEAVPKQVHCISDINGQNNQIFQSIDSSMATTKAESKKKKRESQDPHQRNIPDQKNTIHCQRMNAPRNSCNGKGVEKIGANDENSNQERGLTRMSGGGCGALNKSIGAPDK